MRGLLVPLALFGPLVTEPPLAQHDQEIAVLAGATIQKSELIRES